MRVTTRGAIVFFELPDTCVHPVAYGGNLGGASGPHHVKFNATFVNRTAQKCQLTGYRGPDQGGIIQH